MAERPVFIPLAKRGRLVQQIMVPFTWHSGMSVSQKKKNVAALHQAAACRNLEPLLEVSTKSDERLGQRLSAFSLKVELGDADVVFESAFQGSKVFEKGGPFTDLYEADARTSKRDSRLQESGRLVSFRFQGVEFPLYPKTAFYDWLYIRALFPHREFLRRLHKYAGFTDIEFNPERSINCQARSCATLVALQKQDLLESCMSSFQKFAEILETDSVLQPHSTEHRQNILSV